MEVRLGYKQTEVGVIPEDWAVVPIKSLLEKNGRITYGVVQPGKDDPRGVLFVRGGDIFDGKIDVANLRRIPRSISRSYARTLLRGGEILISLVGFPGESAIVPEELAGSNIARQVALVRLGNSEGVNPGFICHYLRSDRGKCLLLKEAFGSAQQVINLKDINKLQLPLSKKIEEQRAIATALSDMDALLDRLDHLIAKKRAIKQATMQQLLTGQTRLPGFRGEWEVRRLGDHLNFLQNGVNSRAELSNEGGVRYLHYGDIHGAESLLLNPVKTPMPRLPEMKAKGLDRLKDGDLIFADASEDLDGVGKAVEIQGVEDIEAVSGLHTIAVRFDKSVLADGFKAYIQFIPSFRAHLRQLAAGTKVYATNRAHITSAEMELPSAKEQAAIAATLSDMDAEIAALEARHIKTRALKQAMMQELLTGRTRLVAPVAKDIEVKITDIPLQAVKRNALNEVPPVEQKNGSRQANVHFKRTVLAAEIVDQLHNEPTFGHVKLEKLIFLAEHLCKLDIGSHYHRDAAGPYDNRALRSIDSQLKRSQWFEAKKSGARFRYVPLAKHGGHKRYFNSYYTDIHQKLDEIIATFRVATTEQCEVVATLYSAWDDLIKQSRSVSDEAIVDQVLNHWTDSKKRIEADRWHKALSWMREKGFVPEGASKT